MNQMELVSAITDYRAAAVALHETKTQLEEKVSLTIFFFSFV